MGSTANKQIYLQRAVMTVQYPSVMFVVLFATLTALTEAVRYTPDWTSLDSRPNPAWYDEAKFGIFMHWGLYSVQSYSSEWMWNQWRSSKRKDVVKFIEDNYRPGWRYEDFASMFTAEFFDPDHFAEVIKGSGAKYYVLTSKHHEGFTMWHSNTSWNWNAVDTGPHTDIVARLKSSFQSKAPDVHFGLYFSQYDWYHPLYLGDQASGYQTRLYPTQVQTPQLYEIVNTFKPDIVWSDGDWDAPDSYWQSQQFIAWLYNDSPVKDKVVTNDRWGRGIMCHHGGFNTCSDRYNPGVLQKRKWENCMTVDSLSWGFRRTAQLKDILPIGELLNQLVSTVSCGGNLLLNVGPTHDGRIVPVFEERLGQIGAWLKVNGEAVYGTKPWIYQNDTIDGNVWYTSKSTTQTPRDMYNKQTTSTIVYAHVLQWPASGKLTLGAPTFAQGTKVTMLGYQDELRFKPQAGAKGGTIDLTTVKWWKMQSTTAWVLKFTGLGDDHTIPRME